MNAEQKFQWFNKHREKNKKRLKIWAEAVKREKDSKPKERQCLQIFNMRTNLNLGKV